ILLFALFDLQILKGDFYGELSKKNYIRLVPQEGMRGRVFDRNGDILVDNTLTYDVAVLLEKNSSSNKILRKLALILKKDPLLLRQNYEKNYSSGFIPTVVAKDISVEEAMFLEENRFRLPEILIKTRLQRKYPHRDLCSHILGYLGEIDPWRLKALSGYGYVPKDTVGFGGIEERYDYLLRQKTGGISFQVDRKNRIVRIIGYKPPKNGKDIQLTIDMRIQKITEESLKGKKGSIIVMDPYTGEILSMASMPNFSPEDFLRKGPQVKDYFQNPQAPLLNRAVLGVYPLGSIFKLVVAMAGMKSHKLDPKTTFFCSGKIRLGDREFRCWQEHKEEDLYWAIVHSCNVYFYRA
ncbi:MAG: penicillin-binding transpeptidase domain-containing protein, partial [Candidatus Omnitrophica bacterium]|nr:penicillin-binding transpeptidase domain-containing protein [Candidatus Omnitrophota bacterium]